MHAIVAPSLALLASVGQQVPLPAHEARVLASATAQFANDLYRVLDDAPGNLIFSPHSIAQALSMARAGAAGETAAAFDRALHLPEGGAGERFRWLADALRAQRSPDGEHDLYQLSLATSMWGQRGYEYVPAFLAALETNFGASFFDVDFGQPDSVRGQINAWVASATRDRIVELLPKGRPSSDSRLVLVDAIYFKGTWSEKFVAGMTAPKPFHATGEREVLAPTMHRIDWIGYGETALAQVAALPYAGGLQMLVVLPRAGHGLSELVESERIDTWTASMQHREVALWLPKFTMRSTLDLGDALQALGLGVAFDRQRADFSRITQHEGLCIEAVLHQAFIEVDEQGTEAAAATAVDVAPTSAARQPSPSELVRMVVDRPFLFVVRHAMTGAVLFLGRVDDPTSK